MFNVAHYPPSHHHKWLICLFEAFRFNESTYTLDKFIPRPVVSMIFHFQDRPLIFEKPQILLEPFFIAPIIPKTMILKLGGQMDVFTVTCNPTVFSRIFNIDLSPVSKKSINLPNDIFLPLWEELKEMQSDEERIIHFNQFISSHVGTGRYLPDAIDILYKKILEKSIKTPLHHIMEECGCSCRTLQRKFIKRTGVTPKTLMRIVRLNYLLTKIRNNYNIDCQDLVFDGNYFDQAHFINDFKDIVGETPGHFFIKRDQKADDPFSWKVDNSEI